MLVLFYSLYILQIYKAIVLALFATFCGGKKLNKNKEKAEKNNKKQIKNLLYKK